VDEGVGGSKGVRVRVGGVRGGGGGGGGEGMGGRGEGREDLSRLNLGLHRGKGNSSEGSKREAERINTWLLSKIRENNEEKKNRERSRVKFERKYSTVLEGKNKMEGRVMEELCEKPTESHKIGEEAKSTYGV